MKCFFHVLAWISLRVWVYAGSRDVKWAKSMQCVFVKNLEERRNRLEKKFLQDHGTPCIREKERKDVDALLDEMGMK